MTDYMQMTIGQQVGNYRLIQLLGSGGFADVYLGEHLHLGTYAAIKILRTKLDSAQVELFLLEARTVAHLLHPHIVRVFDFDVQDMSPFLVMDYAPGGTLRQKHPKGSTVPLTLVVDYVKQIASALDYAHSQKLIHRDVKPENMLLMQDDQLVLSDFGVASIAHSTQSQTLAELAGTIFYSAPEQLQGHPRVASDQYALGVVAYEWLSGHRPFQGSFGEVASQHLFTPPPPLQDLDEHISGVSQAVENSIFTALAKEPQARFATLTAFAEALEQASKGPYTIRLPEVNDSTSSYTTITQGTQHNPLVTRALPSEPLETILLPNGLGDGATNFSPIPSAEQSVPAQDQVSQAEVPIAYSAHASFEAVAGSSLEMASTPYISPPPARPPLPQKRLILAYVCISVLIVGLFASIAYAFTRMNAAQTTTRTPGATATIGSNYSDTTGTSPMAYASATATVMAPTTPTKSATKPASTTAPTTHITAPATQPAVSTLRPTPPLQPSPMPTLQPSPTTVLQPSPSPAPPLTQKPVQPPTCPANVQSGSNNSMVQTLQNSLNAHYSSGDFPNAPHNFAPPLATDGDFGTLTLSAVEDYQQAHHIQVDGVVGPLTWHALGYC